MLSTFIITWKLRGAIKIITKGTHTVQEVVTSTRAEVHTENNMTT